MQQQKPKKTISSAIYERIASMAPLSERELLGRALKNEFVYDAALSQPDAQISHFGAFLAAVEKRETKTPGNFFPLLHLFGLSHDLKENGGDLLVIGGWNSFLYLFAAFGEKIINRWRGSHDLDLFALNSAVPSLLQSMSVRHQSLNLEIYNSIAHEGKKSGILSYNKKSCQIDLYVPDKNLDGNRGFLIEELHIPLNSLSREYIDSFALSVIDPVTYITMKSLPNRKKDYCDIVDTFSALRILYQDGFAVDSPEMVVSKMDNKYKSKLYELFILNSINAKFTVDENLAKSVIEDTIKQLSSELDIDLESKASSVFEN